MIIIKKLITGEKLPIIIPSQKQLLDVITKTIGVCNVNYRGNEAMIDLSKIEALDSFAGTYNIVKAKFPKKYLFQQKIDQKAKGLVLISKTGDVYKEGDDLYDLAKLDFYYPTTNHIMFLNHGPIHFIFAESICAIHYNMDKESNLYKLLKPHTRFQLSIDSLVEDNGVGNPIYNTDNWWNKYINPLGVFSSTLASVNCLTSVSLNNFYNQDKELRKFQCPPKLDSKIPYLKALQDYYEAIETFVTNLVETDNKVSSTSSLKTQIDDLISCLSKYMPFIKEYDPIKIIATFIWNVSIHHSSTHQSAYLNLQGLELKDLKESNITPKIHPFLITKDLRNCDANTKPEDIIDQNYGERQKNFGSIFTRFNHNPDQVLDFTMENLSYDLPEQFQGCVSQFKDDLNKVAGENADFIPLDEMAPSIAM